jgi:hypothetical protein
VLQVLNLSVELRFAVAFESATLASGGTLAVSHDERGKARFVLDLEVSRGRARHSDAT